MRIGLAYALAEPVVRSTLVRSAAFFGCASAVWALLPLYVRQVLGAFIRVFRADDGGHRRRCGAGRLDDAPAAQIVFAQGTSSTRVIPGVMTAYAALLVFGIGWIVGASNLQAIVQLATAPWVRARVLALYQAVFNSGMGLGGRSASMRVCPERFSPRALEAA